MNHFSIKTSLTILGICCLTLPASAYVNPKLGVHEVQATLIYQHNIPPKITVNPMTRDSYVIFIRNSKALKKWVPQGEYIGTVQAKVKITLSQTGQGEAELQKLTLKPGERSLVYDGDLVVVPNAQPR